MSLLSAIVALTGHQAISDLRPEFASAADKKQIKHIIETLPHDNYSEQEWNEALKYLGLLS